MDTKFHIQGILTLLSPLVRPCNNYPKKERNKLSPNHLIVFKRLDLKLRVSKYVH